MNILYPLFSLRKPIRKTEFYIKGGGVVILEKTVDFFGFLGLLSFNLD